MRGGLNVLRPFKAFNPFQNQGFGKTIDQQIAALHAASTQSLWLDPSRMDTLFQDSAGTVAGANKLRVARANDRSGKGNHATQSTEANAPFLVDDVVLWFDSGDSLSVTFSSSLGANCTVVSAVPGTGVSVLTGQTIGAGAYAISADTAGFHVFDRALSSNEIATITKFLEMKLDSLKTPSAFSHVKALLETDSGDVDILVLGDSTSDGATEWCRLFSHWLTNEYPTHSVVYRLWDDSTKTYGSTNNSTGTGIHTLTIWNGSIGGTIAPSITLDGRYAGMVEGVDPDVVIWNYGHNIVTSVAEIVLAYDSSITPWMEMVQTTHPDARHVIITQNPRRDDDDYAPVNAMQVAIARDKANVTLVDVYSRFIALAKDPGLYVDNVHPSSEGSQVAHGAVTDMWSGSLPGNYAITERWLAQGGVNLLVNGDFADFSGNTPAGWTRAASTTVTKDTTIVDNGDAYSVKLERNSGSSGNIYQILSAPALASAKASGSISLAVRMNRGAFTGSGIGRIQITVIAPSGNFSAYPAGAWRSEGIWYWNTIRDIAIPADATSIYIYLHGALIGEQVYYGRAVCVAGRVPRDKI